MAGPGRDEQIEQVIQSIRAAGKAGLPVIEYNFYAHRLTEGYKEETGRGGAGYTAYDYELSKNLPPQEGVGTHTRAEQLKQRRVFPESRRARSAKKPTCAWPSIPTTRPCPLSRGSEQIMATLRAVEGATSTSSRAPTTA